MTNVAYLHPEFVDLRQQIRSLAAMLKHPESKEIYLEIQLLVEHVAALLRDLPEGVCLDSVALLLQELPQHDERIALLVCNKPAE